MQNAGKYIKIDTPIVPFQIQLLSLSIPQHVSNNIHVYVKSPCGTGAYLVNRIHVMQKQIF
jgi:hypothetical protein